MGANSIKGVVLMETIYPSTSRTVFDDPKMAAKLKKEMDKGNIKKPSAGDTEDVDDDLDAKLQTCVNEVWGYYDPKNLGNINKKQCLKFFKDALELYAWRQNKKVKEVLGQGVNKGKALEECYGLMSNNQPTVTKAQFEAYIFTNDLEEVMGPLTGKNTGLDIPSHLPKEKMFDPNSLPKGATGVDMTNIQYRDYNQTLDL